MDGVGPKYSETMRAWWIISWKDRAGEYSVTDQEYVQLIVDLHRKGGLKSLLKVECFTATEIDITPR